MGDMWQWKFHLRSISSLEKRFLPLFRRQVLVAAFSSHN